MTVGYYNYRKNENIHAKYTIEFTRNKRVYDRMDKSDFDFSELDKREFHYLEDAIRVWNTLYYDETVLHLMLWEEIMDGEETLLEQCKDQTLPTVLDSISKKRVEDAEKLAERYRKENEILTSFLKKYGIDAKEIVLKGMYENA